MRNRFYLIIALFTTLSLVSSCTDHLDSEGVSRITNYAVITLNDPDDQFVLAGSNYAEPGAIATENGSNIDLNIKYQGTYFSSSVSTTLDTSQPDVYTAIYSATNKDGFPGSKTRHLYVAGKGDLVNSIEGIYTSTVVRNGTASAQYQDMEYVIIKKTGANTYELSDAIGGYYDLGRAYGPAYAASGYEITADDIPNNKFTFGDPVGVGPFGGANELTSMTVDPATKTIKFVAKWDAGYTFEVTLKQVNF